jgi:hypothetical protein
MYRAVGQTGNTVCAHGTNVQTKAINACIPHQVVVRVALILLKHLLRDQRCLLHPA